MNKRTLIASAAVILAVVACTKDPGTGKEEPKAEELKAPVLTSDVASVTIREYTDDPAVTFNWTKASETLDVEYSFIYGLKGSSSTKLVKCGSNLSKSFTVNELNAIGVEFGLEAETAFELEVSIEAKSSAVAKPAASDALALAVVYDIPEPEPLELYGIGDAFPWGWNRASAEKMQTEDHITFTWSGWLESGNGKAFKFLTNESVSNESWLPSYGRDGNNESEYWSLALRQSESETDTQFSVENSGNYDITVNVETMTVSVVYQGDGKTHLFGVGAAFDWGWKLDNSVEMATEDQTTFTWTGDGNAGGFKFILSRTSWAKGYNWDKEADGGVEPTGDETEWSIFLRDENVVGTADDNYFKFTKAGNYTVTVNLETNKLTIKYNGLRSDYVPETNYDMDGLYLYGPANPNGPKLANEIALTLTDEATRTYVYEGNLLASDGFKLMAKSGKWWPAFVMDVNDETGSTMLYSKGEIDKYWPVTESGYYRVTAVVNTLKITIVRLGDSK